MSGALLDRSIEAFGKAPPSDQYLATTRLQLNRWLSQSRTSCVPMLSALAVCTTNGAGLRFRPATHQYLPVTGVSQPNL